MPDDLPAVISFPSPTASRIIVTDLTGKIVTFVDHLTSSMRARHILNGPFELQFAVPADNPEINRLRPTGTDPFVAEGVGLVYWFLRYGIDLASGGNEFMDPSSGPWQCVGSGIILDIDDRGDADAPTSTVNAWDPWKLLYRAPVLTSLGNLPGDDVVSSKATGTIDMVAPYDRGGAIAKEMLRRVVEKHGDIYHPRIDYGQTGAYDGTIEDTPLLTKMQFQHGMSVGEVWDAVVKTGTCDIVLKPIYDPLNRAGMLSELSVYNKVGAYRGNAVFSWDRWPRSNVEMTRRQDGNERANYVQMYSGPGGPPVDPALDDDSIDKFGAYFEQQTFPGQARANVVEAIRERELEQKKLRPTSYTVSPAPERSPIPFKEYHLGDRIPVAASARLRVKIDETLRVHEIPMVLNENEIPHVDEVLVAEDTPQVTTPEPG